MRKLRELGTISDARLVSLRDRLAQRVEAEGAAPNRLTRVESNIHRD
jgi:hypothetical protein